MGLAPLAPIARRVVIREVSPSGFEELHRSAFFESEFSDVNHAATSRETPSNGKLSSSKIEEIASPHLSRTWPKSLFGMRTTTSFASIPRYFVGLSHVSQDVWLTVFPRSSTTIVHG